MLKNEQELFDRLKDYAIPDLVRAPHQNSRYDCASKMNKVAIELKCRRVHYDELMIEHGKYRALFDNFMVTGFKPVYVCATPNGVWLFSLTKIREPQWVTKRLPTKTEFGYPKMKPKMVGFIDVSQGQDITDILRIKRL